MIAQIVEQGIDANFSAARQHRYLAEQLVLDTWALIQVKHYLRLKQIVPIFNYYTATIRKQQHYQQKNQQQQQ